MRPACGGAAATGETGCPAGRSQTENIVGSLCWTGRAALQGSCDLPPSLRRCLSAGGDVRGQLTAAVTALQPGYAEPGPTAPDRHRLGGRSGRVGRPSAEPNRWYGRTAAGCSGAPPSEMLLVVFEDDEQPIGAAGPGHCTATYNTVSKSFFFLNIYSLIACEHTDRGGDKLSGSWPPSDPDLDG